MAELKHVGRVSATNKKCVVAYRTLPGDAHYCLIVPTENLPDTYHNSLINLVESAAGQESYEFAEALDRNFFPDGSNMLRTLHTTGRLIKAPTSAIEMTPTTGFSVLLSELNQIIAEQRGVAVDELSVRPSTPVEQTKELDIPKTKNNDNPAAKTTSSGDGVDNSSMPTSMAMPTTFDSVDSEAKFYRSQADKLAKEAAAFRRKAEELVPTKKTK
ncbi:MAG: hypothetical protein RLZZ196_626 [Bacteroidota bacterium]|jgi:hypothetical protein